MEQSILGHKCANFCVFISIFFSFLHRCLCSCHTDQPVLSHERMTVLSCCRPRSEQTPGTL